MGKWGEKDYQNVDYQDVKYAREKYIILAD